MITARLLLSTWVLIAMATTAPADRAASRFTTGLLPATTRAYVASNNVQQTLTAWQQTHLAKAFDDPTMQPFLETFRRGAFGGAGWEMTWTDLQRIAGGQVCGAIVEFQPGKAGSVLLVNTAGHGAAVRQLLNRLDRQATQAGAARSVQQAAGNRIVVFHLPATGAPPGPPAQRCYCRQEDLLIVSDQPDLVRTILRIQADGGRDRLGRHPASQWIIATTTTTTTATASPVEPHLSWYVEPFALHQLTGTGEAPAARDAWRLAGSQGFDAIRAVGGAVMFAADRHDVAYRTAIYAPPPYDKAARMLRFPSGLVLSAPKWVPAKIGQYAALQWDLVTALDAYGSWFDATYGEGEQGMFDDVLTGIRDDPDAPGVDIRSELVAHLHGPLYVLRDSAPRDSAAGTSCLFAFGVTDQRAVESAVRRLLEGDPGVSRRTIESHIVWVFRDTGAQEAVTNRAVGATSSDDETPALGPDLSNYAVTVAQGRLLVATRVELLEKILQHNPDAPWLGADPQYQSVSSQLKQFTDDQTVLFQFARPGENVRDMYEGLRAGPTRPGESVSSRLIAILLQSFSPRRTEPNGKRPSVRIDFTQLPPFTKLRPYLGPSGSVAKNVDKGWLWTGLMLPAQDP